MVPSMYLKTQESKMCFLEVGILKNQEAPLKGRDGKGNSWRGHEKVPTTNFARDAT